MAGVRILHDGFSALRFVDDDERFFLVDPADDARYDDVRGDHAVAIVLSGGPWAERYGGAVQLARAGRRPTVIASRPVLDWLANHGEIVAHEPPATFPGAAVEAMPYAPYEPKRGTRDRLRAAIRRPKFALGRLQRRFELPDTPPLAWRLRVAHDHVIVHLGLGLHPGADAGFLDRARAWCDGAVVIAGYPHGEGAAFIEHIRALRPKRLLLMDQTNDVRRQAGLDTELVTPVRDALVGLGIDTHPYVSGVSVRFEQDDTIKRW